MAAVYVENHKKVYVFGGQGRTQHKKDTYQDDTTTFDLRTNRWETTPVTLERPRGRAQHSMVCVGSKIVLFAGSEGTMTFNDMWILDVDALQVRGVMITDKGVTVMYDIRVKCEGCLMCGAEGNMVDVLLTFLACSVCGLKSTHDVLIWSVRDTVECTLT